MKDKSLKSVTVVELDEDMVKDLRERNKKRKTQDESAVIYKILDSVEEQTDNKDGNEGQNAERFLVWGFLNKGKAEKGVEIDQSFKVLDSLAEQEEKQESTEDPLKSQSKVSVEEKAHVEEKRETFTTGSKRKREEGHEEEQAVHSKTLKTNDKDGEEQETFAILDSIDDRS